MGIKSFPSKGLQGELQAPGDKSVSHRGLILGALAEGRTRITGLLESDDVLATLKVFATAGSGPVTKTQEGVWEIKGFFL